MSDAEIKYMDIKEFREGGYLSEINRRVLHPLGLAMSINVDEDGTETLHSVWDSREDPEGFIFGDDLMETVRVNAGRIEKIWAEREAARVKTLGYMVQPVDQEKVE